MFKRVLFWVSVCVLCVRREDGEERSQTSLSLLRPEGSVSQSHSDRIYLPSFRTHTWTNLPLTGSSVMGRGQRSACLSSGMSYLSVWRTVSPSVRSNVSISPHWITNASVTRSSSHPKVMLICSTTDETHNRNTTSSCDTHRMMMRGKWHNRSIHPIICKIKAIIWSGACLTF